MCELPVVKLQLRSTEGDARRPAPGAPGRAQGQQLRGAWARFSANLEALRSKLPERSTTLLMPRTLCRISRTTIDRADGLRALPARPPSTQGLGSSSSHLLRASWRQIWTNHHPVHDEVQAASVGGAGD